MNEILHPKSRSVERDPASVRTRRTGPDDEGKGSGLFDPEQWNGPPPDESPYPPLRGFVMVPNTLSAIPRSQLGSSAKMVHIALKWMAWRVAEKAKSPGPAEFWIFLADLARRTGLSVGHVRRQIAILISAGLVRVRKDEKCFANGYTGRWFTVLDDPSEAVAPTDGRSLEDASELPEGCARRRADGVRAGEQTVCAPARTKEDSGEERGKKSTLNVVASPGGGAGEGTSQASPEVTQPDPGPEIGPTADPATKLSWAESFIQRLKRDEGFSLRLVEDGKIRAIGDPNHVGIGPEPSDYAKMQIRILRPQLVEVLGSPAGVAEPGRGRADAGPKTAPKVEISMEAKAQALIGRFAGDEGKAACAEWARLLTYELFREDDPETSLKTLQGLASCAREGREMISPGLLSEALTTACRPGVRIRGARFIKAVKDLKSEEHKRRKSRGATGQEFRPSP